MKNLNIDKSAWKLVKFGDVVAEPKESVSGIASSGLEHLVGLEHIDSESIHLCRSANLQDEETTFTKVFRSGDVLFGRRRAYLKKAAQANFDGVCSGDITIFRAKKNLLPELLPFVVNNDKFFDYAVKHSAGGLSPRVKFKDLANYEFLLPPTEQQAELAELLWAMDEVFVKDLAVLDKLQNSRASFINNFLKINANSNLTTLGELTSICTGKLDSNASTENGIYPFFTCSPETLAINNYAFDCEALLLAGNNAEGNFNVKHYSGKFNAYQRTYVIEINKSQSLGYEYLFEVLKFQLQHLKKMSVGSSTKFLTLKVIQGIQVPVLPIDAEKEFVNKVKEFSSSILSNETKISASKSLQKSLINEIF